MARLVLLCAISRRPAAEEKDAFDCARFTHPWLGGFHASRQTFTCLKVLHEDCVRPVWVPLGSPKMDPDSMV